jgi:hypothetical protein
MEALRVLSKFINMAIVLINRTRNKRWPDQPNRSIHDEDGIEMGIPLNRALWKMDTKVSGIAKETITNPFHLLVSSWVLLPKLILNKSQTPGKRAEKISFNRCQKITCSDERA